MSGIDDPTRSWDRIPAWTPNTVTFGDTRVTEQERAAGIVADASGVVRVRPASTLQPGSVEELRDVLALASRQNLRVTVAGTRHSGGGQSLIDGAVLLDMRRMDGLSYDAATGALHVQPGATWEQVQRYLDGHGRGVPVAQSSNVFSVGGSLATNIHGRDVRFGPIIDAVESVKVLLASGREVRASRTRNPDLFRTVIGGYGQAGIITEATLRTVANEQLTRTKRRLTIAQLPAYFAQVARDPGARMLQVRLPVDARNRFSEAIAFESRADSTRPVVPMSPRMQSPLADLASRAAFRTAIHTDVGKRMLWHLQTKFGGTGSASRNQVMNPSVEFLRSKSTEHRQVLQEYFVPRDRIGEFLAGLSRTVDEHDANLLNVTLRWTPAERTTSALSYAPRDSVAVVLYVDQRTGTAAQQQMDAFTRAAAQVSLDAGGTFYLPYQLDAFTRPQLDAAYPDRAAFFATIRRWDPENRFAGGIEKLAP